MPKATFRSSLPANGYTWTHHPDYRMKVAAQPIPLQAVCSSTTLPVDDLPVKDHCPTYPFGKHHAAMPTDPPVQVFCVREPMNSVPWTRSRVVFLNIAP